MITRLLPIPVLLLIGALLSTCGPSQAQLDTAATQVASNVFATLTAQAPTVTPTFTPSPTSTETPTSTPTPPPTKTPTLVPMSTSTPRITPTPRLMAFALTSKDLPAGFVAVPSEQLGDLTQYWSDRAYAFALADENRSQAVVGVFILYAKRADQLTFDATLPQVVEIAAASFGGTDYEKLEGLEEIGEARAAITSVSRTSSISYRWDIVGFRRGQVAVLLIVTYPDGDKPAATLSDLARKLEGRLSLFPGTQVAYLRGK